MKEFFIDNRNISNVVPILLELDSSAAQEGYQDQMNRLLKSLQIGWEAYNQVETCFMKGETMINIIDHYLLALIDTANALYKILDEETQRQLMRNIG